MRGRDACYKHGGPSLRGAAHPRATHLRTSPFAAYIPQQLRAGYEAVLADPEARELRDEKVLAGWLLTLQLQRVGSGEDAAAVGAALIETQGIVGDLQAALNAGDTVAAMAAADRLEAALNAGTAAEGRRRAAVRAEDEVRKTTDLRRKIAESESRIIARRQAFASIEQLQAMMFLLAEKAATAFAAFEARMTARGIPADEAAEDGRAVLGEFVAELQAIVPPPEPVH